MKKTILILIAGCSRAFAQPTPSPGQGGTQNDWFGQRRNRQTQGQPGQEGRCRGKKFRRGGEQGQAGGRQGRMQKFDANGDGQLDEGERQAAMQGRGGKMRERMQKFDANGDGQLDEEAQADLSVRAGEDRQPLGLGTGERNNGQGGLQVTGRDYPIPGHYRPVNPGGPIEPYNHARGGR